MLCKQSKFNNNENKLQCKKGFNFPIETVRITIFKHFKPKCIELRRRRELHRKKEKRTSRIQAIV